MVPMSEHSTANAHPSPDAARTLIAERDQLRSWLDQLDEHGSEVPKHVVERVRGDYRERLQRVNAELTEHLGSLRQSLAELRELQSTAEEQHAEARDALAEARLRHMIGELDASAWEDRRPGLEAAVVDAERERDAVSGEVSRLVELVSEIEGAAVVAIEVATEAAAPEILAEIAPEQIVDAALEDTDGGDDDAAADEAEADEDAADEVDAAVDELFAVWDAEAEPDAEVDSGADGVADVQLPWLTPEEPGEREGMELEFLREVIEPAAAEESGEGAGEESFSDLAFLEELDRVIASTAPGAGIGGAAESPEAEATSGLTCKECGASNDARSWYCEICGMELT